jgi:integrase
VAARLGHASPTITLTTYAHVLPKTDEHAALAMASVLA